MKTKDLDLTTGEASSEGGDHGDNKYEKIRHQQAQFRRTMVIVLGIALMALGILHFYTNASGQTYEQILISELRGTQKQKQQQPQKQKQQQTHEGSTEHELEDIFRQLDSEVRKIKSTTIIMETDEHAKQVTGRLQSAARKLMIQRYGKPPYRLKMDLEFQDAQIQVVEGPKFASLLIEMAPIDLVPYSVFNFLEIARGYKGGGFHRNAGHVLQAAVSTEYVKKPLAFQEYSPEFPHALGTVGYCGRPSGVCWYVSIKDNTKNHGPGSQQKENPYEADANWGKVIEGMDDVVPRIHNSMTPKNKFLPKKKDWVLVKAMHILVSDGKGGFKEWQQPPQSDS